MQTHFMPPDDVVQSATRGLIATLNDKVIRRADGQVAWDLGRFDFLDEPHCPSTVSPMLWRQAQLCRPHGLFFVTEGIYQIRGLDAANMTIVESNQGIVVIDALMSTETAAQGLALYRQERGERKVMALIYTHPHGDHYGGARGVLPVGHDDVPIYAPKDFMYHAVSENVIAGSAMGRRAGFQFGARLPQSPEGHVSCGTCLGVSVGSRELLPPNHDITETGQEESIDGVRFVFQMTPGTEAPAEMNMMIPDKRALCVSENASQSLHNLTALRGSLVRDSQAWSRYLDETIVLFGQETDVCFGGHNWPVWGTDAVLRFLSEQRDLYAYLHDQTILKMSQGLTGIEIAEELHLPVGLDTAWHAQSFYGSLNQNVKSIYQRYMGWYDGNPAHLWEHPPVAASQRYVSCMGGAEDVLRKAAEYEKDQDFRFAATLLNHLVFAQPTHDEAKTRLADLYERLAWSQMCAPWRDSYLVAALELRTGPPQPGGAPATDGVLAAANIEQILSSLAVRIDGSRAQYMSVDLELQITDGHVNKRLFRVFISHGALIQRKLPCSHSSASPRCLLTKRQLLHLVLTGNVAEDMQEQGNEAMVQLQQLAGLIQLPRSNFNIVTP